MLPHAVAIAGPSASDPQHGHAMAMRARLKQATNDCHRRLEQSLEARGLFRSLDGYGLWLQGALLFHRAIQDALADRGSHDVLDASVMSQRCLLIEDDLDDLGLGPAGGDIRLALPVGDEVERLGVAYVVEGAAIGARIILREAAGLGCHSAHAARFLSAAVNDTSRWPRLVAMLDRLDLDEGEARRMEDASQRTFETAEVCYRAVPCQAR